MLKELHDSRFVGHFGVNLLREYEIGPNGSTSELTLKSESKIVNYVPPKSPETRKGD